MTKTQHYNLNKPEAGDPIRVADFNQNSDIIDAALKNLNTAVSNVGNCKIVTGSYTGDGTYGKDNPTTLTFEFEPKMVMIWKNEYRPASTGSTVTRVGHWSPYFVILLPHVELMHTCVGSSDSSLSRLSFSGNTVQVYNTSSAALQWNSGGTYYYIAIG